MGEVAPAETLAEEGDPSRWLAKNLKNGPAGAKNIAVGVIDSGFNAIGTVFFHGGTAVEQLYHGKPGGALSSLAGIPGSLLSGDFNSIDMSGINPDPDAKVHIVSFNGIHNNENDRNILSSIITRKCGQAPYHVHNPTASFLLKGDGDKVFQVPANELGATDIVAIKGATALRSHIETGKPVWIIAHSQGTATAYKSIKLLPRELRKQIVFFGYGGQQYVDAEYTGIAASFNFMHDATESGAPWSVTPPLPAGSPSIDGERNKMAPRVFRQPAKMFLGNIAQEGLIGLITGNNVWYREESVPYSDAVAKVNTEGLVPWVSPVKVGLRIRYAIDGKTMNYIKFSLPDPLTDDQKTRANHGFKDFYTDYLPEVP